MLSAIRDSAIGGKVQEASSGLGKGHRKRRAKLWSSEKENLEDTEQEAVSHKTPTIMK